MGRVKPKLKINAKMTVHYECQSCGAVNKDEVCPRCQNSESTKHKARKL